MAENSKIEWTDHTFNPWIGCARVSEGCRHCYAERMAARFGIAEWGSSPRRRTSESTWQQPLAWNRRAEREGRRFSVFPSLCDPFDDHPSVDDSHARDDFFNLIYETPHLDWLLLTKRPENLRKAGGIDALASFESWQFCNVRIGVSVEDQATADARIPELLRHWAGPNFVSYEPALGPVDFRTIDTGSRFEPRFLDALTGTRGTTAGIGAIFGEYGEHKGRVHWLIAGGESGPHARPAHPDWFRAARDQCQAAGVPYFHKQNGEWVHTSEVDAWPRYQCEALIPENCRWAYDNDDGQPTGWYRVGKRRAGRRLDGREWMECP